MSGECCCIGDEFCDYCLPHRAELRKMIEGGFHWSISSLQEEYEETPTKLTLANALFALAYCVFVTNHPERRDKKVEETMLSKCVVDLYEYITVACNDEFSREKEKRDDLGRDFSVSIGLVNAP